MPPNHAGKAASLAGSHDVDKLFAFEDIDQDFVAHFHPIGRGFGLRFGAGGGDFDIDLAHLPHRRQAVLAQVPTHRLVDARTLDELHQADLRRFVTIFSGGLALRHHARAGLQHRDRAHVAFAVEQLRHADFFADDPVNRHCLVPFSSSCARVYPAAHWLEPKL